MQYAPQIHIVPDFAVFMEELPLCLPRAEDKIIIEHKDNFHQLPGRRQSLT